MIVMKIPFTWAYKGRSTNVNSQECINLFPHTDGKTFFALYGSPGLKLWWDSGERGVAVRALLAISDSLLYAVVGNQVFRINPDGTYSVAGTMHSSTGVAFMDTNGEDIILCASGEGWRINLATNAMTELTGVGGFPSDPGKPCNIDTYMVVNGTTSGTFYWSSYHNATVWDALDYATAEVGGPDWLVACLSDHRELWLFGEHSIEVWYNSGGSPIWSIMSGGMIERGCGAAGSVVKLDNSIFWLDDLRQIVRANGYTPIVVSTREIEYHLASYDTVSDAIAFGYVLEGHAFYQITFPSANRTWVYDASNGMWHERRSYPSEGRHRANCYARFLGKHMVGDWQQGKIYELDMDTYTDDGEEIVRQFASQPINDELKLIFYNWLVLDCEAGVGLREGQGDDPQAMLRWSNDGGHTWSNEHWASMGKIGEYGRRVRWTRLGSGRNRVWQVRITDPVKVVIKDAYFEATRER